MILPERKNIFLIWLAQLISSAGDAIYQIALIWLVLDITGSNTITGLVVLSAYLPAMLFGLMAGVMADRYNRIRLMLLSNFSQAFTVILIPVLLSLGYENVYLVGILAFVRSSFGTIFPPALNAFIPTIVPANYLVRVNSLLATSAQLAYLIGPATAAILLGLISLKHLFTIDSATFLLAVVLLCFIRSPKKTTPQKPESSHTWGELKQGLVYIRQQSTIGVIIILTIINNLFIMGPAIVGMPILVKSALNGTASDYAAIEACYAIGMLISSFVIFRIGDHFRKGRMLMLGMIMDGLTFCGLYFINSIPVVMVMIIIHALGIPMITISRTAIIQSYVPNKLQGRVFSMIHLAVVGLTGVSSALVGIMSDIIPIKTVFLLIGIGAAICGIVGLLYRSIRSLE
ncbi:MAG: MFS transporter [Candidatus Marinimicrobia bacterium]|nr:MFS transporter [Candidatus Neomarinimicrobiota bacterium]